MPNSLQANDGPAFTGQAFHDSSLGHSNRNGHACECNDALWICDDCDEAKLCRCFTQKVFACGPLEVTDAKQLRLFAG